MLIGRLQMEEKKKELHRVPIRKLLVSIKRDLKHGIREVAASGKPKRK
jgi:hypothetical protein